MPYPDRRDFGGTAPDAPARSVPRGPISALFQPIERLKTAEVVGFEALARMATPGGLLGPDAFLSGLSPAGRADLFFAMLGHAASLLRVASTPSFQPYVSVNVEPSTLMTPGFLDGLGRKLDGLGFPGDRLVVELLEGDEIEDFAPVAALLSTVRARGIRVALDDVGSGYASLAHLRELPVDFVKLDQSFTRRLSARPEDLHFTHSLQTLCNGLDKRLIVEGVETLDIRDALRVLGVDFAQGYAIAKPMPVEAVGPWLAGRGRRDADVVPGSLLGAYAGHLRVVEICRALMEQPLPVSWREECRDPHACSIGRFFDSRGLHETSIGRAHKAFHEVMDLYDVDRDRWKAGAEEFRRALLCEIVGPAGEIRA